MKRIGEGSRKTRRRSGVIVLSAVHDRNIPHFLLKRSGRKFDRPGRYEFSHGLRIAFDFGISGISPEKKAAVRTRGRDWKRVDEGISSRKTSATRVKFKRKR